MRYLFQISYFLVLVLISCSLPHRQQKAPARNALHLSEGHRNAGRDHRRNPAAGLNLQHFVLLGGLRPRPRVRLRRHRRQPRVRGEGDVLPQGRLRG